MAFYDKFPYTNYQEINLDKLAERTGDLDRAVEEATTQAEASAASAALAKVSENNAKASETSAANSQRMAAASQEAAEDSAAGIRTLSEQIVENSERIDTILVSGTPTQGNAELIDIRSGGDGVTYPTAGDAVRGQFYDVNNALSTNIFNVNNWENGAFNATNGQPVASTERIRSKTYLPVSIKRAYSTNAQIRFLLYAYNSSGAYMGGWNGDGFTSNDVTPFAELDMAAIFKNYPTYKFKLSIRLSGGSIQISNASGIYFSNAILENMLVNNPTYEKMRIMQWNAGRFNFGNDGGLSEDVEMYIHRIRDYIAAEQPDVITMQEFTTPIDTDKMYPTNATLFTPVFLHESHEEHLMTVKSQKMQTESAFSYLHTTGDNPAYCIYTNTSIGGHRAMMVSAVLCATAPEGIDHLQQQIRALTKLTDRIIGNTPFAVIGMDANVMDLVEVEAVKQFMADRGYQSANWNHFGNIATLQPGTGEYECIDNVFVKGAAKITGCKVDLEPRYLPSDHSPLIVDICWRAD